MKAEASSPESLQTERTTVKRLANRGAYDRPAVHAILDEALFCHVGFTVGGQPFVLPTIHARVGERIYLHGSAASRMLRTLATGLEVCVTVTLLDGLVLARSAFHHSMNYRSVVILGSARAVLEPEEKVSALRAIVDHVVPGRWDSVRSPNAQEIKATSVLALPLSEASAKLRVGGPLDDEEDHQIPVWAGQLPLTLTPGAPVPDVRLQPGLELPPYLGAYQRPKANGR